MRSNPKPPGPWNGNIGARSLQPPTNTLGASNAGTLGIWPTSADQPSSVPINNLALYRAISICVNLLQLAALGRIAGWARALLYMQFIPLRILLQYAPLGSSQ